MTLYAGGTELNRHGHTAAHLLVTAEDYPAIADFHFPHNSFWTDLLPAELAAFNLGSQDRPMRAALLTFVVTYVKSGLASIRWEPPSWQEDFHKKIGDVRTMFESVLSEGATCLSPQLSALGRSFYVLNIMEVLSSYPEEPEPPVAFCDAGTVRVSGGEWWFNAVSATKAIFTARTC